MNPAIILVLLGHMALQSWPAVWMWRWPANNETDRS